MLLHQFLTGTGLADEDKDALKDMLRKQTSKIRLEFTEFNMHHKSHPDATETFPTFFFDRLKHTVWVYLAKRFMPEDDYGKRLMDFGITYAAEIDRLLKE